MSAEPIARVIADLRAGRVRSLLPGDPKGYQLAMQHFPSITVVDATAIYLSLVANNKPVYLYEDHPCIAPPWPSAAVCYLNEHGNVLIMQTSAHQYSKQQRQQFWEPAHPVDWDRVRWVIDTFLWLGGSSTSGGPFPTCGPAHLWRFAVYEDGQPADLHWVQLLAEYPMEHWDMAHLVLLGALNFMNCRNVELVPVAGNRHQRKRLARLGVQVHTISVFPAGRSVQGGARGEPVGVPLTSVRGHFALYGPEHGRGLLFGKHAGRYWIPQHARGTAEHGTSETEYRLMPPAELAGSLSNRTTPHEP